MNQRNWRLSHAKLNLVTRKRVLSAVLVSCATFGVAAGEANEDNLLRNGDFTHGTDDWTIALNVPAVVVTRDPQRHDRWVLKIPTRDGVFSLSQQFALSANATTISGDFQVLVTDASKDKPVEIRVRFYDADANSPIVAGRTITTTHQWHTVVIPRLNLPEPMRDRFLIESNRGQGNIIISPVFLTAQTDEAARTRYVSKLAELRDELTTFGRNPGDPALAQIDSEIRANAAPPEMDSGKLSKLLVGTWLAVSDVYEYSADGTWSMVSAAQSSPRGEWHIESKQFFKTATDNPQSDRTTNGNQYTIILLNDKDFVFADGDRVFHETRVSPAEVDKLVGLAIPDLLPNPGGAPWDESISAESLGSLEFARRHIFDVHRQLASNRAGPPIPGSAEFKSVLKLLKTPSLPIKERDLLGEWRCRSTNVATVGVFTFAFHKCRFARKDGALSFERTGGYAVLRRKGYLYRNDESSFIFVGSRTVYDVEGHQSGGPSESVGILLRKSEDRYLMILDPSPRMYEIYEIRR